MIKVYYGLAPPAGGTFLVNVRPSRGSVYPLKSGDILGWGLQPAPHRQALALALCNDAAGTGKFDLLDADALAELFRFMPEDRGWVISDSFVLAILNAA